MEGKHMMPGMPMMKDKEMEGMMKKKKMMKQNSYSKETVAMAKGMMK